MEIDSDDVPTPVTALIAALSQDGEMLTTPLPSKQAAAVNAVRVRKPPNKMLIR